MNKKETLLHETLKEYLLQLDLAINSLKDAFDHYKEKRWMTGMNPIGWSVLMPLQGVFTYNRYLYPKGVTYDFFFIKGRCPYVYRYGQEGCEVIARRRYDDEAIYKLT